MIDVTSCTWISTLGMLRDDLVGGGRECEWRRIDWNSDPAIGVNLQFRLITDILSIRINEHGWCIKYVWAQFYSEEDFARQQVAIWERQTWRQRLSWQFCSTPPPCTKSLGITDLIVKNPNKQNSANVRFKVMPYVWYTLSEVHSIWLNKGPCGDNPVMHCKSLFQILPGQLVSNQIHSFGPTGSYLALDWYSKPSRDHLSKHRMTKCV